MNGADGGSGAFAYLANDVSGDANADANASDFVMNQVATGGAGGDSTDANGGSGGAATSDLTWDNIVYDLGARWSSPAVSVNLEATGGAGGYGLDAGLGGTGGGATAVLNVTNTSVLVATVSAQGGAGGGSDGAGAASGGGAFAQTVVSGATSALVRTSAIGGAHSASEAALAASTISADSGQSTTSASTGDVADPNPLVAGMNVVVQAPVEGTTAEIARVGLATAPAYVANMQGVGVLTGAPNDASVSAVLSANSNIAAGFGGSPGFYALGELGGAHSTSGSDSQTITVSASMLTSGALATGGGDLMLGLFHPTVNGSGFDSLNFEVEGNGQVLLQDRFTDAASATAFFTDHAIDLGALTADLPNISFVLTIVSATGGGGFDFGLILGDPSQAENAVAAPAAASAATRDFAAIPTAAEMDHAWLPHGALSALFDHGHALMM